jgi:tetratricopeptide (TPR) repeat protein
MTSVRFAGPVVIFLSIIVFLGTGLISRASGESGREVTIDKERTGDPEFQSLSKALAHYIMGGIYDNLGEISSAITEYREVLSVKNDIADVYMKLGADLMMTGELEPAASNVQKAIELDPSDKRKDLLLGIIYTAKKDYDKAEEVYRKVLESEPDNFRALAFLSDIYVLRKDFKKAAEIYEKMLAMNQNDAFLYFNLGIIYSKTDQMEKATESLKKALEIDKGYIEAQMVLGFVYEVQGDFRQAAEQYESVTAKDPMNKEAYTRLGHVNFRLGKTDEAIICIRKLMAIEPDSPEPYLKMFSIYSIRGKYGEARRVLQEAIDKNVPAGGVFYASMGYLDILERDFEKAVEHYSLAITKEPENTLYKFYLGIAYDKLGNRKKAKEIMEECVAGGAESAEVYNYLGYIYAEEGRNLDRAVELVKKALEIDPGNGAYLDSMGWVYYKKGMLKEAFDYVIRAAEVLPNDPVVTEHLGDIYFTLGDHEKALENWEKALEIDPGNKGLKKKIEKLPVAEPQP